MKRAKAGGSEYCYTQDVTPVLIERSAKVQYMASAITEARPIVDTDMPGKFGLMPSHFFRIFLGPLRIEGS